MERIEAADLNLYFGLRCHKGVRLPTEQTSVAVQRSYGILRQLVPRPRTVRRMAERLMFRYHTGGGSKAALYHEPNYLPLPYEGPQVLTVCDLSCFDHPETHPLERVRMMEQHLPAALKKADHIIVISEATSAALRHWFDVKPERITTTYLAADGRFRMRSYDEVKPGLSELGLNPGEYILSVGTLEPRKNLNTLFTAYASLSTDLRRRFPLVVAGMNGWISDDLMKSAKSMVERGELRFLGYVADRLIGDLYSGAAAFCYPSRYEGFGLPALEAMASGVPVITGNTTSLPEVVGDTGLLVHPDDVEGFRDGLRHLLEDRDLASDLSNRGLARAQSFSWDRCAAETFDVYKNVMNKRGFGV